jgi:uncharacterized membrane protein HdeD (DUF308 family)
MQEDNINNKEDNLIENMSIRSQSKDSIFVNRVPKKKKKTLIISIVLLIFGIVFLFAGLISIDSDEFGFEYIFMIIIGFILLITGSFFIVYFCLAKRTSNIEKRRNIYDKIPEI